MTEYDNTNRGAAFKPFDTQKMILQGKINIEGNDRKTVLVADTTKGGTQLIEVYQKLGVFFVNDKKGNEQAPDYSGPIEEYVAKAKLKMAGWKKQSEAGANFLSISVSEAQQGGGQQTQANAVGKINDDIPF